jgi:hypothetical protein
LREADMSGDLYKAAGFKVIVKEDGTKAGPFLLCFHGNMNIKVGDCRESAHWSDRRESAFGLLTRERIYK